MNILKKICRYKLFSNHMNLLRCYLFVTMIVLSCSENNNHGVDFKISRNSVEIKNAKTSMTVDNAISFRILYGKNDNSFLLTDPTGKSSIGLKDSLGNKIYLTRKSARAMNISDIFGTGKMIMIEAESDDKRILCNIFLSAYTDFPDAILVRSSFKNISSVKYPCFGYVLNQLLINPSPDKSQKWWTFQGAAYNWGQDFIFQLPGNFSRDNYMGMNDIKDGGGIPVTDIWNKNYGISLACMSDRPQDVYLPVREDNGKVGLGIEKRGNYAILPNDSLLTLQTAIIVHQGDFYEPLRTFSRLIKPLLPVFQKPSATGYKPEWCTWGYSQQFRTENILSKVDTLLAAGISSVILDDGWSLNHGDWIPDPSKFPGGDIDFKKLISKLHRKGLKVWIWWRPGYVDSTTSVAQLHPEWLMKNKDGSVHPSYGFCPAYAPVQEYYRKLVQKFTEDYRLDGLKLDFREINSAPPCYNPVHNHTDPDESYFSTPELYKNICETAHKYNPDIVIEYCACGIPPTIYHLPFINLAVTSDPNISQITSRIKMYKALLGNDFPVLEEYNGVLAGPMYQLTIGTGGVAGTFSTYIDQYHTKWLDIYNKYQLSKGEYLNLYDIAFDYPEGHAIRKDEKIFYAFYTHPWDQLEAGKRYNRFNTEFDGKNSDRREFKFPDEQWSGKLELRGLDPISEYRVLDYGEKRDLGIIKGKDPFLNISFSNYLLLEAIPER